MMRTVPLNCGMSKSTVALPSASSFTGPEKKATSLSVGGLPCASHAVAVAAGAQASGGAERAVDQPAVEVAQFEAEPALAEIPGFRIGRLVVGQVEDADIDRSDGHIGVRCGGQAGHRDGNRQRLARLGLFDRRKRDRQLACCRGRSASHLRPMARDGHARLLRLRRAGTGWPSHRRRRPSRRRRECRPSSRLPARWP